MNEKIFSIMTALLLGDSVGYTLEGLGKGHIKSMLGKISGFTDPAEALKGHIERWRKPGLCSASAQIALSAALVTRGREISASALSKALASFDRTGFDETDPFRHPARILTRFIMKSRGSLAPEDHVAISTCYAFPSVSAAALSVSAARIPDFAELVVYASSLGCDIDSSAGAVICAKTLSLYADESEIQPLQLCVSVSEDFIEWCGENSPVLFGAGLNPDKALSSAKDYLLLFRSLENCSSLSDGEKIIAAAVNRRIKTPVTRGTVDHPFAVFPFSVLCAQLSSSALSAALTAAEEGGCSSVICSLACAFAAAVRGDGSLEPLYSAFINKRGYQSLIEKVASGTASPRDFPGYIESEISLSSKEKDERESRMKHGKVSASPSQPKTRSEKDNALSRHVVESWTKLDKARWKKERKRGEDAEDET